MREKKSARQVTLSSLTLEMEKGNFDGSVLQGVWMAVSGGGQTWVISWWRKKNNQQSLETRGNASNFFLQCFDNSMRASFTRGIYMCFMSSLWSFIVKLHLHLHSNASPVWPDRDTYILHEAALTKTFPYCHIFKKLTLIPSAFCHFLQLLMQVLSLEVKKMSEKCLFEESSERN